MVSAGPAGLTATGRQSARTCQADNSIDDGSAFPPWSFSVDCGTLSFYEYFHGDNGAGLGAGHHTGRTGLAGRLIELFGILDPDGYLTGRKRISRQHAIKIGKKRSPS
jgi:hypothetical protein